MKGKNISNETKTQEVDVTKKIIMNLLLAVSIFIMTSGIGFGIYSIVHHIEFLVLKANVPGSIFGLVVAYLGLRYFLSVIKLKKEVYKPTSSFSWKNFKKEKKVRA